MKKKIKDLTIEEILNIKKSCLTSLDCETCPLNYRKDGIQSLLCEIANELENNTFIESLEQEIEVSKNGW